MATCALVLDCAALVNTDCATIDLIARLQLEVRRCGLELQLRNANESLLELIDLAGLARVLGVEPGRQSEERKHFRCVEEEGQLDDPSA
jgi:ABC-type transporter Mla MlaB component